VIIQGNDPFTQPSFSLGNRVRRTAWNLAWMLLFRPSPRLVFGWRVFLLRLFGARIGRGVNIHPSVRIWAPWNLVVGDECGIGYNANLYNMAPITLGKRCVISQGAHLCAGSHDIDSPNFQLITGPIALQAMVWICTEAFIGLGVHIAEGCVIGARAVIARDINEPWTVWVGNPATCRRKRINQETRS
jgi:putative colanic acid biosynthesis acetyltransferase WcaF